jgi:hypothetical protein
MGFKARKPAIKDPIQASIVSTLKAKAPMSKRQIVAELRQKPAIDSSVRGVVSGLGELITAGALQQTGSRAKARFSLT